MKRDQPTTGSRSSMVECLTSMHRILGSIPGINKEKIKEGRGGRQRDKESYPEWSCSPESQHRGRRIASEFKVSLGY